MEHGVAEEPIRLGLITAAIGFEPSDDVRIQAHLGHPAEEEERFLSAQTDRFAGAKRIEKVGSLRSK
jgi:hypothetical protein